MSAATKLPAVGSRWKLKRDVDRFPHFVAPAGAEGTITDTYDSNISLRLDEPLAGAEEWDNEVVWAHGNAGGRPDRIFFEDCEAIT